MEIDSLLANLSLGFSVAITAQNMFWCLVGAIIGTAIGVLPGVGPVATMALLLPATYFLPAEGHRDLTRTRDRQHVPIGQIERA